MTIPSGCWRGTGGMACADDAKANAKATANNLIIVTLLLKSPKAGLLPLGAHQPTSGGRSSLIWINECSLPSWGIRVRGAVTKSPLRLARRL
jgi:hypothetical protein